MLFRSGKIAKSLVLVAEDEPSASLLVELILKKAGMDVIVVTDGQQAVNACRQNPMISLVLMDLKMPVMNGFEATKEIRSFKPHLPIVAITAYALSGDENRALSAGCNDYIAKPYTQGALMKKIMQYGLVV